MCVSVLLLRNVWEVSSLGLPIGAFLNACACLLVHISTCLGIDSLIDTRYGSHDICLSSSFFRGMSSSMALACSHLVTKVNGIENITLVRTPLKSRASLVAQW